MKKYIVPVIVIVIFVLIILALASTQWTSTNQFKEDIKKTFANKKAELTCEEPKFIVNESAIYCLDTDLLLSCLEGEIKINDSKIYCSNYSGGEI